MPRFSGWVWVAIILTAVYFVIAWQILSPEPASSSCSEGEAILLAACLTLNEIGDLAAGMFAPIAFVWVAVAVLVQSQELNAQREELKLTRDEMTAQREVWEEQLNETRAQTRVLTVEGEERKEAQADRQLDELLNAIARLIAVQPDAFTFSVTVPKGDHVLPAIMSVGVSRTRPVADATNVDDRMLALAEDAISTQATTSYAYADSARAIDALSIRIVVSALDQIDQLRPALSKAAKIRLDTICLDDFALVIRHLNDLGDH